MSADQSPTTAPDCTQTRLTALLLSLVPADGSTIGNTALRRQIEAHLTAEGLTLPAADYWLAQAGLVEQGLLV